jgi:hypothetical protein
VRGFFCGASPSSPLAVHWWVVRDNGVRPWTDEYTNIVGPLVALQVAMRRGK